MMDLRDICWIYYPEGAAGKLPLIIDIHGGGFLYSYKEFNKLYGYHLAKRGFAVANINYRLADKTVKVPDHIRDVIQAVNWLADNLKDYPIDGNKAFISGESAGGVLAVMTVLISKNKRLQEIFDAEGTRLGIKALAINCGMMGFTRKSLAYWGLRSMCLEKGYKKQAYYQCFDFEQLPEMKNLVPTLLTSSDEDELRQMTLDFEKVLQKYGVKYEMVYFNKKEDKKLGHMFSVLHPDYEESRELMDRMTEFFRSQVA